MSEAFVGECLHSYGDKLFFREKATGGLYVADASAPEKLTPLKVIKDESAAPEKAEAASAGKFEPSKLHDLIKSKLTFSHDNDIVVLCQVEPGLDASK